MSQKFTILFDLDGTLVNTAPDLMRAHNHVMKNQKMLEILLNNLSQTSQN